MPGLVRRMSERIRKSFRQKRRPVVARAADTIDARPVKKGCIRCKIALLDGNDLTIDVEVCCFEYLMLFLHVNSTLKELLHCSDTLHIT